MTRIERLLPLLERLVGARLRLREAGATDAPDPAARRVPIPEVDGWSLEIANGTISKPPTPGAGPGVVQELAQIVGSVLSAERDAAQVAAELSERYEEIDLIYTISEILGHTIRLDEAAGRILREVSTVVGARRATLLVHDAEHRILRIVAALGVDLQDVEPVEVDDPCSVAARVFREMRIISYDPTDSQAASPGCSEGRNYRGQAFLSVPVLYAAPGARGKPIGVINLTDRLGQDAFTAGDRKLVAAIAIRSARRSRTRGSWRATSGSNACYASSSWRAISSSSCSPRLSWWRRASTWPRAAARPSRWGETSITCSTSAPTASA